MRGMISVFWTSGNWSSASGEQAMTRLLDSYPEMDAVFIDNDQMALGAMQCLYRRGLRVPEDVAIVGYDDLPEAAYYWPPLTSIRQNLSVLGSTAVKELVRIIEADPQDKKTSQPKVITLQPELIIRESSLNIGTGR